MKLSSIFFNKYKIYAMKHSKKKDFILFGELDVGKKVLKYVEKFENLESVYFGSDSVYLIQKDKTVLSWNDNYHLMVENCVSKFSPTKNDLLSKLSIKSKNFLMVVGDSHVFCVIDQ
jgi:negative regulator of genetic competence, sporulation and motility